MEKISMRHDDVYVLTRVLYANEENNLYKDSEFTRGVSSEELVDVFDSDVCVKFDKDGNQVIAKAVELIKEVIEANKGVPVPNSVTNPEEELGYWYWNSFASVDEVVSAFKKLTYVEVEDGIYVYHVLVSASQPGENWVIQYTKSNDSYVFYRTNTDPAYPEKEVVFTSKAFPDGFDVISPIAGWHWFNHSGENYWFDIPTNEYQGRPVGTENDKIASIFSMTPFEKPAFAPNGSAPVPNDGSYVEKIYFNTLITFDELVGRLFTLPANQGPNGIVYNIVQNSLNNKHLAIALMPYNGSSICMLGNANFDIVYYVSSDITHPGTGEMLKSGWQVDSIDWNDNTAGNGGVNDWLVDIVSITPNFATKQTESSINYTLIAGMNNEFHPVD